MLPLILTLFEIVVLLLTIGCCYNRLACLSFLALIAAAVVGTLEGLRGSSLHLDSLTYDSSSITGRSSMQAAIYKLDGFDVDWTTATISIPHHSEFSLLLQVKAISVNPSNFKHPMIPTAWPFLRHIRDWPVGYDVSGVVLSVGTSSACDVKVGDHVWGMSIGVAGEYAVLPCNWVAPVPGKLTYSEAAGLGVAGLTSMQAYERNTVQQGQHVLVIGASGGCGQFGVGLAGAMGANISGICGTQNVEFVQSLYPGVSVVDYKNKKDMDTLTSHQGRFDVIYDTVSSSAPEDPNYEPTLRPVLKPDGTYIAIGPCPDIVDQVRGFLDVFARVFGLRVQRPGYDWFLLSPSKALMKRLNHFYDSGSLKNVAIDSVFDLTQEGTVQLAIKRMKSRRAVGKVILTFGNGAGTSE
mmetsp:Transcript_97154/g.118987  ORF Transcript_97154/g.118987 Transcript_97154/m.118987 type:complete len:410 (+) Transcript_97154:41-1270(+)